MNLPRWLVIVGIAIIALGLVLCGVGVGRGVTEPTPAPDTSPQKSLDVIPAGAVRADSIAISGCTRTSTRITITGQCRLTVQPGILPLELRMVVISGAARFEVAQEIRGDRQTSAPDDVFPAESPTPGPTATPQVKIKVTGSAVEVTVKCATSTCALRVIE